MEYHESLDIKIKRVMKDGIPDMFRFTPLIGLYKIETIFMPNSLHVIQKRNRAMVHYLEMHFSEQIEEYKKKESPKYVRDMNAPIWFFWWQGIELMPEIIRMCYENRRKVAGNHPIILLTKDNVKNYVHFPDFVWEQFENKKLRIQHLADMIRVHLIRHYGGIWLDASIYCVHEIPESVFSQPVFSLRKEYDERFVSEGKWTTFAIGGTIENILFAYLDDFFIRYCETGKPFIDYFMFDCAIMVAYRNLPQVRKEIDDLPCSEGSLYWLNDILLEKKDKYLNEVSAQDIFQKIGWSTLANTDVEIPEDSTYGYLVNKELTHE